MIIMSKIAKLSITTAVVMLSILSVAFSAYGLVQGSGLYATYKMQEGYNACLVDVNSEIARQQQAAQANTELNEE